MSFMWSTAKVWDSPQRQRRTTRTLEHVVPVAEKIWRSLGRFELSSCSDFAEELGRPEKKEPVNRKTKLN